MQVHVNQRTLQAKRTKKKIFNTSAALVNELRGTAKGPGLKIGNDHKLVVYLEKEIGKKGKSPYAALQNIINSKLKFETKICFKTFIII